MIEVEGDVVYYCLFKCPFCGEQNEIAYEDLEPLPCVVTCARCDIKFKLTHIREA
jgi:transcription elongation factor Elf1